MDPCNAFTIPLAQPEIAALAERRDVGKCIESWIGRLARLFPKAVALRVLDQAGFQETLAVWADQLTKARIPQALADPTIRQSYPPGFRLGRPYNQLPCTLSGLAAKAARITEEFGPEARILLVGDDDQLSPLLVRAGYAHVSVVEIDADLVAHLRRCCDGAVRACIHDINAPPPPDFVGRFDLIVLDPPYAAESVRGFVEGALRFAEAGSRPHIHLYCASSCLTRAGIADVKAFLRGRGYGLASFQPAACHYPYPWLIRAFFVAIFALVAFASGVPRLAFRPSLVPRYVSSDQWNLRPVGDVEFGDRSGIV